jgi:hypothetical protein
MRIMRIIPAAIAASVMIAAPVASANAAQTMSREEARVQMQQYCADAARRTDEAARSWHATYCTPEAMARYGGPAVGSGATVAGVGFMLAALLIGILTAD